MTSLGYYPGCSLHGTGRELDMSIKALSEVAGIELREIDDWNCCGATSAHNLSHDLAIALRHASEPAPAPSVLAPDLPSALDAIVGRALRKDPAERFQTAHEFADALGALDLAAQGVAHLDQGRGEARDREGRRAGPRADERRDVHRRARQRHPQFLNGDVGHALQARQAACSSAGRQRRNA